MALIEKIVKGTKEGCIWVKDNKREHPVSMCTDMVNSLVYYLKSAEKPENRKRYETLLPTLRNPMSKYVLKLAIDNTNRSKEIIKEIEESIKASSLKEKV